MYYIRLLADRVEVISESKTIYTIHRTDPVIEGSSDSLMVFIVSSAVNAKTQALRGDVSGTMTRNCMNMPLVGVAASVGAGDRVFTSISGTIYNNDFTLGYSVINGGV